MQRRILPRVCAIVLAISLLFPAASMAQTAEIVLDEQQIAEINAALEDENKELPVDQRFRVMLEPGDLSVTRGLDGGWLNILLMGTDTGNIQLNYGRTDAMLVLSVHTQTGRLKLTSLVRDMLVEIPVYRFKNRINTANAFGGPLLAMKTVNEVLGLNIQRYCSINFSGFERVVDQLGGVWLALDSAEAGIVQARYTKEPQLLTGAQALSYVRIRSLDNNFGRNQRQRKFLISMLDQLKQSDFTQIVEAMSEAFKSMATNLSTHEVIALLPAVMRGVGNMETLSLPQEGAYRFSKMDGGASVIEFDANLVQAAFHQFVYGQ